MESVSTTIDYDFLAARIQNLADSLMMLAEKLNEIVEELVIFVSELIRRIANSFDYSFVNFTSSSISINNAAPRSPPKSYLKEKIEVRFIFLIIKYYPYLCKEMKTIIRNILYFIVRKIFETFFGF